MAGALFLFMIVLGLPIVVGILLIVASRRRGSAFPACGQCGYNVSASIGMTTRCPECGSEFGEVGITPNKTRTNRALLWSGVALALVPSIIVGVSLTTMLAARNQIARGQAAAARAAAAQAAAQAAATQAATAGALPPPLTQAEIDAMNEPQLQQALARVAQARTQEHSPEEQQRLRDEFDMLMDRLREITTAPSESD